MADVWRSTERHFCKICDCWLSGHKRNVLAHERSARHLDNVNRGMINTKKRERDDEEHDKLLQRELRKMNQVAMEALNPSRVSKPLPSYHNRATPHRGAPTQGEMQSISTATAAPNFVLESTVFEQLPSGCDTESFNMDDFSYSAPTQSSIQKGSGPEFAPSFRFNIPDSHPRSISAQEKYDEISKLAAKASAVKEVTSAVKQEKIVEVASAKAVEKSARCVSTKAKEPDESNKPKFSFDIPDDYVSPPASFYEESIVSNLVDEGEMCSVLPSAAAVDEEVNLVKKKSEKSQIYERSNTWDGSEWRQPKNDDLITESTHVNIPKAVKIDGETRLQILRQTNPEAALKYQIEMESLGDRQKLYREQILMSEGSISLQGDVGHLNRSDLNTVKKSVTLSGSSTGFKKRGKIKTETTVAPKVEQVVKVEGNGGSIVKEE
eukprot:GHVH01007570.1.p1 GENE.GHVH01007570.1~~GHVH01007570.1.p1  ORF type:complete len:447 (+),score=73.11 GHVH01007570.1:36-1343(+)